MKFHLLPILSLLAMASAKGQGQVKAGSLSPLLFEATITTENTPTETNLPGGAKRKIYTTSSVRLVNRDILEAMRVGSLLDGTLTGWALYRAAGATGTGDIYAIKTGKTAVPVPDNLLTQPTNLGTATTGTEVVPATGPTKPSLIRKAYATMEVRDGACSATGTQTIKAAAVRVGTANTIVVTRLDNFAVAGESATGVGILSGSFKTLRPQLVNLTPLFPGDTVP